MIEKATSGIARDIRDGDIVLDRIMLNDSGCFAIFMNKTDSGLHRVLNRVNRVSFSIDQHFSRIERNHAKQALRQQRTIGPTNPANPGSLLFSEKT